MARVDEEESAARQRQADVQKAEQDLLEQLEHRGLVDVWKVVKAGLHCERFLESSTGKAVVDRLMDTIIKAQTAWLLESDPCSKASIEAHRNAQVAHLALYALDEVMRDGDAARVELERISREMNE